MYNSESLSLDEIDQILCICVTGVRRSAYAPSAPCVATPLALIVRVPGCQKFQMTAKPGLAQDAL